MCGVRDGGQRRLRSGGGDEVRLVVEDRGASCVALDDVGGRGCEVDEVAVVS